MNNNDDFKELIKSASKDKIVSISDGGLYLCSQKVASSTYPSHKENWSFAPFWLIGETFEKPIPIFSAEYLEYVIKKSKMLMTNFEWDLLSKNNLIEQFDALNSNRLFVIGDLHGCYDELMQELNTIGFNFSKDLLVSVGDLVDRGKDSFKCLKLVEEPWFKAVRGNHEQICLDGALSYEMQKFHCKYGGQWLYKLNAEQQKECMKLILNLPIVLEVNFNNKLYGFVHADVVLNDWKNFKDSVQNFDCLTNENSRFLQSALWGKNRISQGLVDNKFQTVIGVDEVYLGHTIVNQLKQIQNCFYVDTGIVFGGKLTLIEI